MDQRLDLAALVCIGLCLVAQPLPAAGLRDVLERLGGEAQSDGAREFLEPDAAFILTTDRGADDRVQFDWQIAEGYYLYRDKMKFESLAPGVELAKVELPRGEMKDDPGFGRVEIYRHAATVEVALRAAAAVPAGARLRVTYQGCAEDGICYPPIKQEIVLAAQVANSAPTAEAHAIANDTRAAAGTALSESDEIAGRLASEPLTAVIGSFYVFGLLLAFTPCVLPMVPILSGIILGQAQAITTRRGILLSGVYVVAMAATYALAGMIAAVSGRNLQAAAQHPAVLVAFSIMFVLLALSMFGLYELQMPARLQTWIDARSRAWAGGNYAGVAVMGLLSAVIVGPCVAPPLAGALLYIAHQGDALTGGSALFAMGVGMGTPLLILGASAGRLLPRAGAWMRAVKNLFGVVMLGVAIWFLERLIPGPVTLALWAVLMIATAVHIGALDHLDVTASGWRRLRKGLGLALLSYGLILIAGAGAGGDDLLRPLGPLTVTRPADAAPVTFDAIKGVAGLRRALVEAGRQSKPALVDFYADWCIECKRLERETFRVAMVQRELDHWARFRADVTANDAADRALLDTLELYGPPALLFFAADGSEHRQHRVLGFLGPDDFAARLKAARLP